MVFVINCRDQKLVYSSPGHDSLERKAMISITRSVAISLISTLMLALLPAIGCAGQKTQQGSGDMPEEKPRARDFGIRPGVLSPGPLNAITDVSGVSVGHVTLKQGTAIHTGVTAVLP